MRVVGRMAHDERNEYWTPWFSFSNITECKSWAREMRKVRGLSTKARLEYHYVDGTWTAESLLRNYGGDFQKIKSKSNHDSGIALDINVKDIEMRVNKDNSYEGQMEYYRRRIELFYEKIELLQEEAEREEFARSVFGSDSDWEVDTVFFFKMRYRDERVYTFTALKSENGLWYISGRESWCCDWDTLLTSRLMKALEAWVVTEWGRLV